MKKFEMIKAIAAHSGFCPTEDYLKKVNRKKTLEQVKECYDYANRTGNRSFAYVCLTSGVFH